MDWHLAGALDELVEQQGRPGSELAHGLANGGQTGMTGGHHVVPAGDEGVVGHGDAGLA